jgi:glutaredoxin
MMMYWSLFQIMRKVESSLEIDHRRKEMQNNNFTVYSKEGCPYCTKVVQVLQLAGLNHVVYKLGEHFSREAFYGQFGQGSTFPQVVIDGTNLGGCTETVQFLKEKQLV